MSADLLTRADLTTEVESRVRLFFRERRDRAVRHGSEFVDLWDSTAEQISGGKLIRPRLLVESFRALAPEADPKVAIELGAAVEILHFAFLLHDDVIDGDRQRRGRANLIGALTSAQSDHVGARAAEHWANTAAILMGDLLLSAVHQLFARVAIQPGARDRLLALLDDTITETVAGELADVALSDRVIVPDLDVALCTAAQKTATYSFEFPLRIAAILADAGSEIEAAMAAVGHNLGVVFQLQDDLSSVFGDAAVHGKEPFADLREGKVTPIIAYARTTSAWPHVSPRFGRPDLSLAEASAMTEHLRVCGAADFVQSLIDDQLREAREGIHHQDVALPEAIRDLLDHAVTLIQERRS